MFKKTMLTNEQMNQRFENSFAFVAYAINLARSVVREGEGQESNPAVDVLALIAQGQDLLQDDEDDEDEE